jgi:hypothetical protein
MRFAYVTGQFISGKGGNYTHSAAFNEPVMGAVDPVTRTATVVGDKPTTRLFKSEQAMLDFASRQFNGGKPVRAVESAPGVGFVLPVAEEKPAEKGNKKA